MNPYAAIINIDGSCYDNPGGNGGFAGILEMPNEENPEIIFQEGYRPTTNNRMELRALIETLKFLKVAKQRLKESGVTIVEIYTDSENTIRSYHNVETWRTLGWKGVAGIPIRNRDLLKELITLKNSVGFPYRVMHVAGKSSAITKQVDTLAKAGAKKEILKTDRGYIQPKVSRAGTSGGTSPYNAKGETEIIRVFEHAPVARSSQSPYKVKFDISVNGQTEKYFAHCTKEIDALLDRQHFYEVQFNTDPSNPLILSAEELDESEISAQWD